MIRERDNRTPTAPPLLRGNGACRDRRHGAGLAGPHSRRAAARAPDAAADAARSQVGLAELELLPLVPPEDQERVRLGVEHPLVEGYRVVVAEEQVEVLQPV